VSRQFWTELLAWATADGTAIANNAAETIIFNDVTIPANYMQDGRSLILFASGKYSTTATPTLRFRVRWGGVAGVLLLDSGTVTLPTVTNAIWWIEATLQTRSNGSTGTIFGMGLLVINGTTAPTVGSATGAPAIATMSAGGLSAPAASTVDLTTDKALSLTATWSAASASNTLTGHNYHLISGN